MRPSIHQSMYTPPTLTISLNSLPFLSSIHSPPSPIIRPLSSVLCSFPPSTLYPIPYPLSLSLRTVGACYTQRAEHCCPSHCWTSSEGLVSRTPHTLHTPHTLLLLCFDLIKSDVLCCVLISRDYTILYHIELFCFNLILVNSTTSSLLVHLLFLSFLSSLAS